MLWSTSCAVLLAQIGSPGSKQSPLVRNRDAELINAVCAPINARIKGWTAISLASTTREPFLKSLDTMIGYSQGPEAKVLKTIRTSPSALNAEAGLLLTITDLDLNANLVAYSKKDAPDQYVCIRPIHVTNHGRKGVVHHAIQTFPPTWTRDGQYAIVPILQSFSHHFSVEYFLLENTKRGWKIFATSTFAPM